MNKARDVGEIKREIQEKFGFCPPFFAPALRNPELLETLWKETLTKYVNNGLPALWKEALFAYLSAECGNPYCVIVHSCKLSEFDLSAQNIRDLSTGLERLKLADELKELLRLSLRFYKNPIDIDTVAPELKKRLGKQYDNWVPFMTYIVACHRWAEGHADEIGYHEDKRAKDHLKRLLEEAEELKRILRVP